MVGFIKLLSIIDVYSIFWCITSDFKLIYFKFEQPANIYFTSVTFVKLKLDKSNDVNFVLF